MEQTKETTQSPLFSTSNSFHIGKRMTPLGAHARRLLAGYDTRALEAFVQSELGLQVEWPSRFDYDNRYQSIVTTLDHKQQTAFETQLHDAGISDDMVKTQSNGKRVTFRLPAEILKTHPAYENFRAAYDAQEKERGDFGVCA